MATGQYLLPPYLGRPIPSLTSEDISRFWRNVLKTEDEDGCWPWIPALELKEYGQFNVSGALRCAHRVSYFLETGIDPIGFEVCHKCDYPPCVRPSHLFPGTSADNAADKIRKGRHRGTGELPASRLTLIIPPNEYEMIKRAAAADRRSVTNFILYCTSLHLEKLGFVSTDEDTL